MCHFSSVCKMGALIQAQVNTGFQPAQQEERIKKKKVYLFIYFKEYNF